MIVPSIESIVTVTLNPTMDLIVETPRLRVGDHLHGRIRSHVAAGKAINVSRVLARLDTPSTAAGWVGADALQVFEETAHRAGLTTRFTPIDGKTRENITIIDPVYGTETHIRDVGPSVTELEIESLTDELASLAGPSTLMVFTGSFAAGLTTERFGDLLTVCTNKGTQIAVDLEGEALRTAIQKKPWLIKPNQVELGDLVGHVIDNDEILQVGRRLNEDIPVVLVTLGERGAYCFARTTVIRGETALPPERVVSTVGCGDAALAAFVAGFRSGMSVCMAFKQALAVSAAVAMSDLPASFAAEDMQELMKATKIHTIP